MTPRATDGSTTRQSSGEGHRRYGNRGEATCCWSENVWEPLLIPGRALLAQRRLEPELPALRTLCLCPPLIPCWLANRNPGPTVYSLFRAPESHGKLQEEKANDER